MRFADLPLRPPIEPMKSRQVATIPLGENWTYEPKWDGFRCVAFRSGDDVELESKSGQSLTRYFPEIVAALLEVRATRFAIDGELFIESGAGFDFDALLQRIHPAASRVARLAEETPAKYAIFDILVDEAKRPLYERPLAERRRALETFAEKNVRNDGALVVSPATADVSVARAWLAGDAARLDGVIAKRLDLAYDFGGRDAVVKIKRRYTADCVVGGFRRASDGKVASLLLGLYDGDGARSRRLRRQHERGRAPPRRGTARADRRAARLHRRRARAARAAGAKARPSRNGFRCGLAWWSRWRSITSPAGASGTVPNFCAGDPTRRRANARSTSCCSPRNASRHRPSRRAREGLASRK